MKMIEKQGGNGKVQINFENGTAIKSLKFPRSLTIVEYSSGSCFPLTIYKQADADQQQSGCQKQNVR